MDGLIDGWRKERKNNDRRVERWKNGKKRIKNEVTDGLM